MEMSNRLRKTTTTENIHEHKPLYCNVKTASKLTETLYMFQTKIASV